MSEVCPSLLTVLASVPDPRGGRGKRHPLTAILGMAVAAALCGAKRDAAIAEWGRNDGPAFAQALGLTRLKTPCAARLFLLFRRLDRPVLAALARWAEAVLASLPPQETVQPISASLRDRRSHFQHLTGILLALKRVAQRQHH